MSFEGVKGRRRVSSHRVGVGLPVGRGSPAPTALPSPRSASMPRGHVTPRATPPPAFGPPSGPRSRAARPTPRPARRGVHPCDRLPAPPEDDATVLINFDESLFLYLGSVQPLRLVLCHLEELMLLLEQGRDLKGLLLAKVRAAQRRPS